jgi:ABC-type bacteriocin/lantibiotic exporter with double-glycine peptidase domain
MLPQFGSLLGNARRIQKYLLEPFREDKRTLVESPSTDPHVADDRHENGLTLKPPAVGLEGVSLRPSPTANVCLEDVTAQMMQGSLNVICGAVGTGKTTLAKAILGDVPPENGSITVTSKRIGYCAQKPWLTNASIKDIICGPDAELEIDEEWYRTVIHACALEEDIQRLSHRESAKIGSRGVTLSGGQRQRVVREEITHDLDPIANLRQAIARAVYARPSIIILDDVLSALDAKTENHVAENLLGNNGIFRKLGTTVILITHASALSRALPFCLTIY